MTSAVAAALLVVGLTPAQATPTGDGSSFDSPLPLPLSSLDGSFSTTNVGRTERGTWDVTRPPFYPNGTWYEFTAPTSGWISLTNDAPSFDNTLEMWTAAGVFVGFDDDGAGYPNARLVVTVQAGTTYRFAFASLASLASATGPGTVTIRPEPGPMPPTDVTATPGDRSANVTWTAPVTGGPVSGYELTCSDGTTTWACGEPAATATSATVTGLANGTPTTVTVTAVNSVGSAAAPGVTVTPRATSTTTWTTTPTAPVSGEAFTVTVQVTASDAGVPTGTVTLDLGGIATDLPLTDGTATLTGVTATAGTRTVTATYAGSASVAGSTGSGDLLVARAPQTVTLAPLGPLTYGDAPATLSATASSGLPVTFSATGEACTVSGTTLTVVAAGTCEVTAAQAGDSEHLAASDSATLAVAQLPQTLTLEVPDLVYGQSGDVVATSSVEREVTLTATGACTLDGTTVTATDVGTCAVTASEAGTADIAAATPLTVEVEVARRPQTVTIDAIGDVRFAVEPVRVVATSSVGLPVTLTASGACVVDGDELRTVASGDCTVTASQPGDERTLPADDVSTTVRVVGPGTSSTVSLDAQLGDLAAGAPFTVRGSGLLPGSQVVVTVHSTPRELARVTVGADGTALVTGVLPAGLEVGAHRLVVDALGLDGVAVAAEVRFDVAADGTLVRIGDSVLTRPAAPAAPTAAAPALAVTGGGSATVGALALAWLLLGAALVAWRRRATA